MKNIVKTACAAALFLALPAMADVVVVVGAKSAQANMSKDQVAQVFLGKNTSLKPIDQGDGSPIRTEFYKNVTGKEAAQVKALWSKLVFTGKATMPKAVGDNGAVKSALAADPKAIGYIDKSAVDSTVKVVYTP